ncbi:MAG: response regulator [Candidatus Paceibacterota bacterium]
MIEENKNGKKVVLVVEDDLLLVQAYKIKLEKEGMETWVATSGKEAVAFLEKDPPNVVLLDLLLPGLNGFEFLSAIRKNEKWKSVPVIILTNLTQSEENLKIAKDLGAVDYIVKAEIRIGDIIEKVKKYI